jgi:hypothetical protein
MLDWILIGFQLLFFVIQVINLIVGIKRQDINMPVNLGCMAIILILMGIVLTT